MTDETTMRLNLLAQQGVNIMMMGPYSYSNDWRIHLEQKADGIELKTITQKPTLPEAVEEAYYNWQRLIDGKIKDHFQPAIEYQSPETPMEGEFDHKNEIPF